MLGKKPNKVYDPFLKFGLGYKNPECLKKAIATQPKIYDGERLHSAKLTIDSTDSEETLEDAEESRLKMRNKMIQINYGKLNALYETFVSQQEFSVEQTYFSIPSTSNNGSESKEVTSDLPIPKIPKESKLLKMFDTMGVAINSLCTRIDKTLLEDRERRWMLDKKIACDVSWKSKLSTINDENALLKTQVDSVVKERENIKLEYQKLLNSIKETQTQHQKELDELIEHVNQKTYAYADVRAQNQDLLITISELKNKLKTVDMGKNVNTKFDKS
ncbi:hypothetical protein Tco_1059853 [Tanacetum coccineum]